MLILAAVLACAVLFCAAPLLSSDASDPNTESLPIQAFSQEPEVPVYLRPQLSWVVLITGFTAILAGVNTSLKKE